MTRLFLIAVPTIPHFKPPLLGGFFIYETEPLVITTRGSLLIMFNLKIIFAIRFLLLESCRLFRIHGSLMSCRHFSFLSYRVT